MRDIIFDYIDKEKDRQNNTIELIASENFVSDAVLEAQGSILTNKYAEGVPGKRYYGGCQFVDMIEQEAIDRAKILFGAEYANVQPHSGSSANMAVYKALLNNGDTILSMDLNSGGHLTHGSKVSFSGSDYNIVHYGLDLHGYIDYEEARSLAITHKPKLIVAGASAYSREIEFNIFRDIADEVGALLMVDMAHIAGLVAADLHLNPVPYADVVTSTTHKTLRGPRGGLILTNSTPIANKINKAVFPHIQGGPLEHVIAAKAVSFAEATTDEFKKYSKQVIKNAKAMEGIFRANCIPMVSDGTDNHLILLDVYDKFGITGKELQKMLEEIGITANKNSVPNEKLSPFKTSGLRIGTPAVTTRGFRERESRLVATTISNVILGREYKSVKSYLDFLIKINNENEGMRSEWH